MEEVKEEAEMESAETKEDPGTQPDRCPARSRTAPSLPSRNTNGNRFINATKYLMEMSHSFIRGRK